MSSTTMISVSYTHLASASQKKLPIYSVKRDDKKISISFDAAWGADLTDSILSILEKYNVKTTFFVVGKWAERCV